MNAPSLDLCLFLCKHQFRFQKITSLCSYRSRTEQPAPCKKVRVKRQSGFELVWQILFSAFALVFLLIVCHLFSFFSQHLPFFLLSICISFLANCLLSFFVFFLRFLHFTFWLFNMQCASKLMDYWSLRLRLRHIWNKLYERVTNWSDIWGHFQYCPHFFKCPPIPDPICRSNPHFMEVSKSHKSGEKRWK